MKVLITGACGFLGRMLIAELEDRHELRLLDRQVPEQATTFVPGSAERRAQPLVSDWPFVAAEVADAGAVDAVIHLAASVSGLSEYGTQTFHTNALGTFVVLDEARKAGVRRVFCASSLNAFGTFYWRISGAPVSYALLPLDESFPPVPEDPYSLSKLVNEETCAAFSRAYGITTDAFRFAGVWSGEMYDRACRGGLPPTTAWSDDLYQWVHAADVVRGLCQALEAPDLPV